MKRSFFVIRYFYQGSKKIHADPVVLFECFPTLEKSRKKLIRSIIDQKTLAE